MSPSDLAEVIDALGEAHGASINECERFVNVSGLSARCAQRLVQACGLIQWTCTLVDGHGNKFAPETLDQDYAPFRVTVTKQFAQESGALYLLTASGFTCWLDKGHAAQSWRLARLSRPLFTQARVYGDWHGRLNIAPAPATRSPRYLVRETASQRRVPDDIRCWLMEEGSDIDLSDRLHRLWAAKAFECLTLSLANELEQAPDHGGGTVVFRGPPLLRLRLQALTAQGIAQWGGGAFATLQTAVRWVYELSREAELRHAMLATEIARSGRTEAQAHCYFGTYLASALEGAKVTYQLYLGDVTAQTLTALSTLRSHVTEEAARAAESTQKAVAGVAAGLGVGIAMFVARLTAALDPWIVSSIVAVGIGYSALVVWSNAGFIRSQRQQRNAWHARLYRFLPPAEYQKMVREPNQYSTRIYRCTAIVGLLLVTGLGVLIIGYSFAGDGQRPACPEAGDSSEAIAVPEGDPQKRSRPALIWANAPG